MRVLIVVSCLLDVVNMSGQTVSGPKKGDPVAALKTIVVVGEGEGKEVDIAARRQDKPTIYVFVNAATWDRPVARFLRTLDKDLPTKMAADLHVVTVWLTGDVNESTQYLPKAQQSLKLTNTTWTVFPGDVNGPEGWSINSEAHLTAVVVRQNKVVASTGFRSINETDAPAVLESLTK